MKLNILLIATGFLIAVCPCWLMADAQGVTFYIDNDKFGPRGTDRDYTGGFAFSYAASGPERLPFSLDKLVSMFDTRKGDYSTVLMHGFEFGVTAFTPEDITVPEPQPEDRPYASLLYMTGKRHRVYIDDEASINTSLTLGILGLDVASDLQRDIHELLKSDRQPRGWENQISNGGEPTVRFLWEYRKLRGYRRFEDGRRLEWTTATGVSAGYLSAAVAGINVRYGLLSDPWWSFHSSPTGFGDRMLSVPGSYVDGGGFYAWASLSARVNFYNAFLQGQFRDSPVTYDRDELRPVVGNLSMGTGWTFSNLWRISYYLRMQTAEIEEGPADRTLVWGGIMLTIPY